MFNLAETILECMALKHKVMAIQKEVSRRLDVKSKITEWIKRVLEIVFEFTFSKMTERHSEAG